jgi:glycosyltransferase involved in cell wall biosynthesis
MKRKVLIGYNYILHYRVPLFNKLAEKYDVTVLHSGKSMRETNDKYAELIVPVYKIGPFHFQPGFIKEVTKKEYDVVIALFDVAWITTLIAVFIRRKKCKFILWGAWITKNKLANLLRVAFSKRVDSNIFYTHAARKDFISRNVNENKLFVANNTFDVGEQIESFKYILKNRILFVGSLDERKQNDLLIYAFNNIIDKINEDINLTIIGEGSKLESLKRLVSEIGLTKRVEFFGKINDVDYLKEYYKVAIVSVSFGQAGLSVLQSLGYGVPFLTKKNAISGGEITNIRNDYNGILCDDNIKSLQENLLKLCLDIPYARVLGENAFNYYKKYCTMENMANGFIDAIENSRLSEVDVDN